SQSLVTNFAEQWLFVRDIEAKQPDGLIFPDFDESLRSAMRTETDLFLDSVLRGNRSVVDLLTANYSFVNERLARHYGIANVQGSDFRKVVFPPGNPRGGLLGQGSILTLTSYATRTSAVVRGKWVLENLLSAAPPPPPPNIPALKTEGADAGQPKLRELPCADGSDWLRDGEFRRRRPVARSRRRRRHRRLRRVPRRNE